MKNNSFLIFIPLLLLGANNNTNTNSNKVNKNSLKESLDGLVANISNSLTLEDIRDSVGTLEKIGPYLPEPYVDKVDSFVYNFEKINKINELAEFLTREKSTKSKVSVQNVSSKDNFNKILLALKEDIPEEKIKNIRPIIDIVANFDKYKSMIQMISTMNSPSGKSEDKIDSMIEMAMPLLAQNGQSTDKMKDVLQIFKNIATSSSTEESDFKDQNYEDQ